MRRLSLAWTGYKVGGVVALYLAEALKKWGLKITGRLLFLFYAHIVFILLGSSNGKKAF